MSSKSSTMGGILLTAGSCIGAGMLGLPILSGLSGFFPSLLMFFCAWAFMTITGLYLIEVRGFFKQRVHLLTMASRTVGRWGKVVCWIFFLFLFYALLVAYIAGIGSLVSSIFEQYFGWSVPSEAGSLFFVIVFALVVLSGTRKVDLWNRALMFFKLAAFLALVFLGAQKVQGELLMRSEPKYAVFALPILVIAFGFQNMIPSLSDYFDGNLKKVRKSIVYGGLFALVLYLIWQIIVLGIVPFQGEGGILDNLRSGKEASQALLTILGSSWASAFASVLGFFAILTSFLTQTLSLTHFLADGLKERIKKHEDIWLVTLTLLPPLLCALYYPKAFFAAINFAGGICAVTIFGILPVLMVWKGRYQKKYEKNWQMPGGKPLLVAVFAFALFVVFFQISHMFNAPYLPKL